VVDAKDCLRICEFANEGNARERFTMLESDPA